MAPFEKVNVVRRHQPEPEFTPDFWQNTVAFSLRLQSVIVQLEEEILRAEDVAKGRRALPRLIELIGLDRHVDLALEAGAHPDQSFRVCGEQFAIDPRLVMHPLEMRRRHQPDEILVTGFVAREQREMISGIALRIRPVLDRTRRHVSLHADDRLDPGLGRRLVKFNRAMQVAVIGNRDRRHRHFGRLLHQLLHSHRPVEERILGVQVEMNEGIERHAQSL